MEPKKQVRGPRVRVTASALTPSFPSSEEGRKGAERATGGGERWCPWLTAAQSGGSGRLGADWEEKGLPALPSPACCPSWSPRAPWLASPFSSLHLLDGWSSGHKGLTPCVDLDCVFFRSLLGKTVRFQNPFLLSLSFQRTQNKINPH